MLSLLPLIMCLVLGWYLVAHEVRHARTSHTPASVARPVAATAWQRRRAVRDATDPNDAARLSGSWG
jgi:hypothetical protein